MCPYSIFGYHVFRDAGRGQPRRCRCGLTEPRINYRNDYHVTLRNCPCQGKGPGGRADIANCKFWTALNDRRWQHWRLRMAELRYRDAVAAYADAGLAVQRAERELSDERRTPDHPLPERLVRGRALL